MDGKSIMGILLLAAARGSTITISADGADEQRGASTRCVAGRSPGSAKEPHEQRLNGIGVSPGVVSGRAVILIQRAQVLRYQIPPAARVDARARRGSSRAARGRASSSPTSARASRAGAGPRSASLFDAQLLMLDDPMLVPRAAEIMRDQRVNAEWAVQQVFHEFSAVFDEVADPYLRERRATSPTSSAACR